MEVGSREGVVILKIRLTDPERRGGYRTGYSLTFSCTCFIKRIFDENTKNSNTYNSSKWVTGCYF